MFNSGTLTLTNSTVSGNSSTGCCGTGIFNSGNIGGGVLNLTSSIVAQQISGADCFNDNGGSVASFGYNLDSDGTCNLTATGDLPNTNPMLGPLALNPPGSTQTQALLAGSPAIDHIPVGVNGCGTTVTTDQRGVKRPQGVGCDIGAYELQETSKSSVVKLLPWFFDNQLLSGLTHSQAEIACGPTAATMVLQYFFGQTSFTVRQVYGVTGGNAFILNIASAIANLSGNRLQTGYVQTNATSALAAVEAQINAGNPLIALLPTVSGLPGWDSKTLAHYVAIYGYDDRLKLVYYADPAKGLMSTNWGVFSSAWGTASNGDLPYQFIWSHRP